MNYDELHDELLDRSFAIPGHLTGFAVSGGFTMRLDHKFQCAQPSRVLSKFFGLIPTPRLRPVLCNAVVTLFHD